MQETKEMIEKVKKAITKKTANMKMTKDNMEKLTQLENEMLALYREHSIFIIDDANKMIYDDVGGTTDPCTYTYKEYIDTLYMNLCAPGATIIKDNGEYMTDKEYAEIALDKINKLELTYEGDTMNIVKATKDKDALGAHAYIRAHDHGAVEREIPYVMHLGDNEDIARALEERMAGCVTFDWDDLEEMYDMIEYVINILNLPEDQQCEQMINRLRGHLAAGESIDEELQGFVYDLFRKLCNDHNIQYADLDADNIIDAYEYILPKIKKHNGVDTMKDRINNIDLNEKAENIIREIFNDTAFKWDAEHHNISRDKSIEQLHDIFAEYVCDIAYNDHNMGEFFALITNEAIKRYKRGDTMTDLEKLKEGQILHVQGGSVIINHFRIPDVWDMEVDHEAAENPLVVCYDANNNWLGAAPLEDIKDLEIIK